MLRRLPLLLSLGWVVALPGVASGDPAPKPVARPPAKPVPKHSTPIAASKGWHAATPGKTAPTDAAGRPKLVLQGLTIPDHVELTARDEHGGFSAEDLDHAAHILREPSSGNEHPIHPQLVDLVYLIESHFAAHEIRIISGYRTPRK